MRVVGPNEGQPDKTPEPEEWEREVLARIPEPKQRRGAGRPTKRTPARALAIIRSLRDGSTREAAAGAAGMTYQTLYQWTLDVPDMRELVEIAEAAGEDALVGEVRAAARTTWQAAAFLLERRWYKRWGKHDRTDVTIETRRLAEAAAEKYGLDAALIIAKAEEIMREARHATRDE